MNNDDFEKMRKIFNEQLKRSAPNYKFEWRDADIPPYYKPNFRHTTESIFTADFKAAEEEAVREKAWLEIVVFVSTWNVRVECSRSDGKMLSKDVHYQNLQGLFHGLVSRGMKALGKEILNGDTSVYRFRKEA